MIASIATVLLKSGIRRRPSAVRKAFVSWEKIRSIALIIGAADNVNKSQIDRFAKESGKHMEVYYVDPGASKTSYADWHCFSRQQRNFMRLPVRRIQEELRFRKYDVVLNACDGGLLFAHAVAALLTAPCKCAVSDRLGYANLEISRQRSQSLFHYLEEVKRYLQMIKTETSPQNI